MAGDFGTAAYRFCSLIEDESPASARLWLLRVEAALADLYAAAVALPDTEPVADMSSGWLSSSDRASMFEAIRSRLGDKDAYWDVLDPADRDSIVQASIADDLTDVYGEVAAGLAASRSGAAPEDVLFAWRTGFEIHWGHHALGALNAIREILRSESDADL